MHIRCPHCHNPIDVVGADPLTDISCPDCGSSFSLISGETASFAPGAVKTIGHFELLESVGGGHFGTVWKARDTKLDRIVAVKIPRRGQIEGPDAEMFVREARSAAQVKHPGVVAVHEVGREEGTLYIVSDFINGCSLNDWLSGRQLTPREAAELCVKIADALHAAHEAGVVHRDLKPGNVMMDMAGEPHLTDFGLAKREAGEITMTVDGQVLGTPAYMSPEQARGEAHKADRRSDVYALGVILFELLTGELPFRGAQRMMIVQILQEEPPSPRKLQSRIPRDLDTICLKCLEKDPSRRYATAQALADDLRHFLAGEAIHARPIGRLARLWRWSKRQPVVAGLGTAVAVSLVAGTLVASLFAIQAYKERDRANHQRDIAALRSYRTGLAMTQLALDRRDFRAAEQAIAECAQSFRGWEFGYLRNRLDKVIAFRLEPPTRAPVTSLAVHPARPLVAAGTGNGGIEIWNAKKGTHLVHLAIPSKEPQDQNIIIAALSRERAGGVQFSPDGKLLAVYAPVSSSTFVWDWEREKLVYQRQGQERNFITFSGSQSPAPAFSPDGKYLATYVPNGVQLLRRADWKEVWRNTDTSTALAFTKDGKHLIAGGTFGYIKILSSDTGAEKRTITGVAFIVLAIDEADAARQRTYGHQGAITSILPLVDGQRFATGSVDGTVRVWRLEDGKRAGLLQHVGAGVSALTYAPNGQDLLAVSSDGVLQAMRPDDSVPHDSLYYRDFVAVACEPRQALLATATKSSVLIWGDNLFLEPNSDFALLAEGKPGLICFSPDGSLAAMFVQQKLKEVVVIDVKTHKPRFKIPDDWAYDLRFSADSKRLLVSSTCITCYSTETGEKLVQSDPIHKPNITYGERKTPDGKVEKFVQSSSFGHSNERGLWSEANRLLVCGGYPLTAWNESGKRAQAIEVRSDSMVETHSLNLGTGEQSRSTEYLKHNVSRPWESPDHSTIVGDVGDGTIRGWDLSRGQEVFRWKLQKGRLADILANGNLLVENEEKAWEMWTWGFVRHIGVLKHDGPIRCVAVNPRQDRVVTGGEDGKVAIWHMETGEPLLTLTHGRQPISSVAFSNDGQSLSAVNESGLVRTWDAADIAPTR